MARAFRTLAILISVALAAGCSVKESTTPELTGPSELSLALSMSATPDTINQDGTSQSLVVVLARDAAGRAVVGLPIRFDVERDGEIQDYGVLSAKSVLTGSDGRASTFYTAPAPPPNSPVPATTPSAVSILATPNGTNYASNVARAVDIRLVPPGAVPPDETRPVADFVPPVAPGAGVAAVFDATLSKGLAGLVGYAWDFGDGTAGAGVTVQHTFAQGGTYAVRLTVTDTKGQTAWVTKQVTVSAGPTALFTWTQATAGAPVAFDGTASWAIPPAGIVSYAWYRGTVLIASGVTPAPYTFGLPGTYAVTLVVTDTNGFVGTQTQTVTVR